MDKLGIMDILSRIQQMTANGATDSKEKEPAPTDNGKANTNSFLYTYNPFASPTNEKPQVVSQKAPKHLPKNTIDLNASKNLAVDAQKQKGSDMVYLIQRHNAIARRINSKK